MQTLGLSLLGLLASASAGPSVEFRFAPPQGLECEQHYESTVTKEFGDAASRREDATKSVTKLRYEKTDKGYRVTATIKSGQMKRDGKPVDDAMTKLLIGREIVFDVGPAGDLREVHGYDDFVKDMLAALPPEGQKAMAGVLNAEMMRSREVAEWNGRIAGFVGKEAKEGDLWEGEDEFTLPTGPIKFTSLTRFSKIEIRDGLPMVTINFAYAADGAAAKKMMKRVQKGLSGLNAAIPSPSGQPTIHGWGERVIDAHTMTIERERVSQVISAPLQMPGGDQVVMVRTETKTYAFTCNK